MLLEQFRAILRNSDDYDRDLLVSLCKGADIALGKIHDSNRWIPVIERTPTYQESTELEGDTRVSRLLEVTVELVNGDRYVGYAYFDAGRWERQDLVLDLDISQIVAWRSPEPFYGELEL